MAIKRNLSLQEYSRDHHYALLLCWKIKEGFSKGISVERIKKYVNWFYKNHIIEHFKMEEKYMFPVLDSNHELIIRVMQEHKLLVDLFTNTTQIKDSLKQLQIALKNHVRFEEQILFNEIQNVATKEELDLMAKYHHTEKFRDNLSDIFWK
ncbi:hemerythrin domain-containing protein [Lutibacter sp.]|uniref:hemerythrin domain-containing protein n=1 Tax=Lutibacter sp. TaxID=1925666 RepID=UPI0025BBE1CE|nr:hemerythrin domain-containing protein [Lutibacter sp.]MCF6182134.1 hemerythrin domain-containing protein [Lutibacter sp.]